MRRNDKLTAAQEILVAGADLAIKGKTEFSEWDLTVATWNRNKNRFGCRGYEDRYPDHKRVMMEIMSQAKHDNPVRRGLLEKVRSNYYRITPLGIAEAQRLQQQTDSSQTTVRSPQLIYEGIAPYIFHPAFQKFVDDPSEPRTWLEAEAFLGLTRGDSTNLEDCLSKIKTAVHAASSWIEENNQDFLRSGVSGGKKTIRRSYIEKLPNFVNALEARFKIQMEAIRRNG